MMAVSLLSWIKRTGWFFTSDETLGSQPGIDELHVEWDKSDICNHWLKA